MPRQVELVQTITLEDCIICGGPIALGTSQRGFLLKSHASFYCSSGHPQMFSAETEADQLRKQLIAAQERNSALTTQRDSTQKQLDVVLKKARAGICALCHRHFKNVERHMGTKHSLVGVG